MSLLEASCWLALILIAAKAVTPNVTEFANISARLITLLISSWTDVLFAIAAGALGEIMLALVRRWRRVALVVRTLFLAFFAICAIYAVASIGLFRYFHRPLTFELLGLVGNAGAIRSSVLERITLPVAIAMLAAPTIFLALVLAVAREPTQDRDRTRAPDRLVRHRLVVPSQPTSGERADAPMAQPARRVPSHFGGTSRGRTTAGIPEGFPAGISR